MKKISNTVSNVARAIIVTITAICGSMLYFFTEKTMSARCPELWEFLNRSHYDNCEGLAGFVLALIIVIIILGLISAVYAVLFISANHLLKRNIAASTDRYPKSYSTSQHGYTDEDRRDKAQLAYAYCKAYTVKIELTHEEVAGILHYLEMNGDVSYDFPKSFLMPDNISWLQPRISHHTVRCIMKELKPGGSVLLTYKYPFPKRSRIMRGEAVVRIQGNLRHNTYTSEDVLIGFADSNRQH